MPENLIAQRIEALLNASGKDLASLSDRTGIAYHTLHNLWRRPTAKLSAANAEKVATHLNTTSRFILTGEGPSDLDQRAKLLAIYDDLDELGRKEMEDYASFLRQKRLQSGA